MGQKTNPIILRLSLTQNWKNNYPEINLKETKLYDYRYNEIEKFCYIFLKKYNFQLLNFKLFNTTNFNIKICISFLYLKKTDTIINKNTNSKIKEYQILNKTNNITCTNITKKFYLNEFKKQFLFNKLLKSLSVFLKNKNIILLLKQPNNKNMMKRLNKKQLKSLKGQVLQLKRFKDNSFFKISLKILFCCTQIPNTAETLALFIAKNLKKHKKKQQFFLQFVKKNLQFFLQNSLIKINGIKIMVSGRLGGRQRAKNKIILIKKEIPNLTLNKHINYSNVTSYTINGTLGIKVWIYFKN